VYAELASARTSSSVAVRSSCSCAGLGSPGCPDARASGGSPASPRPSISWSGAFGARTPTKPCVTDITEHPTHEGKVYCTVVLDVFSRRVVGWSIDSSTPAALITNALVMAIEQRGPYGTVIHSDQGSPVHLMGVHEAGTRLGAHALDWGVASCFDNAMIESFWSRMQVELLDRKRWRTRVDARNATQGVHQW
jgi:transposase InsO family protein